MNDSIVDATNKGTHGGRAVTIRCGYQYFTEEEIADENRGINQPLADCDIICAPYP